MANPYESIDDLDAAIAGGEASRKTYSDIDSLDAAINDSVSEDQTRLGISAKKSLSSKPEQYIRARQIEGATGVPADVAERNLPELEHKLRLDGLVKTMRETPALGNLMQDPTFLKRTHDDIDALARVEMETRGFRSASELKRKTLDAEVQGTFDRAWKGGLQDTETERNREKTVGDYLGQGASSLWSSRWSASSGLWGVGRAAADVVGKMLPDEIASEVSGFFKRYQQDTKRRADEEMGDRATQGFVEKSVYSGLQSLGQNLLTMPLAMLPGGSASMALGPMVAITGGTEYSAARDAGKNVSTSLIYGASQAAIEYATEVLPVTRFLADIKAGAPFAKMLMATMYNEVRGEEVATLLQDLNQWAIINPQKPFSAYLAERPSAAAETLIATIVGVGGQVATVKGVEALVKSATGNEAGFSDKYFVDAMRRSLDAQRALENEGRLNGLIDAASASASISRDASAVSDLINEAQDGEQSEVFVNARQFATVFNQAPLEVAAALGISEQTLNDALAAGRDLSIPLSTLATAVAADENLRPIVEHARVDPEDMSPADARKWETDQGAKFKADAEAVFERNKADQTFATEVETVRQGVLDQLNATKRWSPEVNKQYATMVRDFYVTMADRAGMTVTDMAKRYPLRVVAKRGTGETIDQSLPLKAVDIGSPKFRNWFGLSRIVDQSGKPATYYHGTARNIEAFKAKQAGAIFLSPSSETANDFSKASADWKERNGVTDDVGPNVIPVHVRAENPFDPDNIAHVIQMQQAIGAEWADEKGRVSQHSIEDIKKGAWMALESEKAQEYIKAKHDSFYVYENGVKNLAVFDPAQIKSAVSNTGEFSLEDPRIYNQASNSSEWDRNSVKASASAAKILENTKARGTSTLDIMRDGKVPKIKGTGTNGKITVWDAANYLAKRAKGKLLGKTPDQVERAMIDGLVAEVAFALSKDGHAVGWYDHKINAALNKMAEKYPELANDKEARFHFTVITAITSNGQDVIKNFEFADQVYGAWRVSKGALPSKVDFGGDRVDGIEKGFASVNDLVSRYGWEKAYEVFLKPMSAGEVTKLTGMEVGGENKDTKVYGAMVLGPKIGSFFANLNGKFDSITMDMWFMRTMGRLDGSLSGIDQTLMTKYLGETESLLDTISNPGEFDNLYGFSKEDIKKDIEKYRKLSPENAADGAYFKKSLPKLYGYIWARYRDYANGATSYVVDEEGNSKQFKPAGKKSPEKKSFAYRLPENYNAKHIYEMVNNIVEDPGSGGHRNWLRSIVLGAQAKLKKAGIDLTNADFQAVIWYYEKDLFNKLGATNERADPADYEVAAERVIAAWRTGLGLASGTGGLGSADGAQVSGADQRNDGRSSGPRGNGVLNQAGQRGPVDTESAKFKLWSGGLDIVTSGAADYQGGAAVFETYHGTTHSDITAFRRQGNSDGFLGAGPYFTTSASDASDNYAGVGPDLTQRIETEKDNLRSAFEDGFDTSAELLEDYFGEVGIEAEVTEENVDDLIAEHGDDALEFMARKRIKGDNDGLIIKTFVRLRNPADTTGKSPPLTYEMVENEDGDVVDEKGTLVDWIVAARDVANQYGIDIEQHVDDLLSEGGDVEMDTVFKSAIKRFSEAYDDNGELMSAGALFSEIAEAAGYDGVIMDADLHFGSGRRGLGGARVPGMSGVQGDTLHIVPFDKTAVKSAIGNSGEYSDENGDFYEQPNRAGFDPNTLTVSLDNPDLSSFHHESAHFFLEVMADMAARPDAAPAIRADFEALLKWFGIQGSPEMDAVNTWAMMPIEEKRQYHEQFAYNYEIYLAEGKAPNIELQPLYQRFAAWMKSVYANIRDNLNVIYKKETGRDLPIMTGEVRAVYDRLLASEASIQTAEAARRFAPIFQTAEQAGKTAEEWAAYQAEAKGATDKAVEELQARSIRDMRWLANAKSRKIKELQKKVKEVRAVEEMDARREIMSQPLYRAWAFLAGKDFDKTKKAPEAKSDPNVVDPTKDTMLVAIAKLGGISKLQAVEEWGLDQKEKMPQVAFGKPIVRKDGGRTLDEMGLALADWGYLPTDESGKYDQHQFEEQFFDALRGADFYSSWGEEAMIRAAQAKVDPDAGITLENTAHAKLNLEMLKGMYGTGETAAWRILSALKMTAADGIAPDQVADLFGFSSGDDLVRTLALADDPKTAITKLTDQKMLEKYAELNTPKDIEIAAERAIHNDFRARTLARELDALRKATDVRQKSDGGGMVNVMLKAARMYADEWLGRQKVKDAVKVGHHTAAESRAAKATEESMKAGDTAAAAVHKRDQLLNHELARGAIRAGDEVQAAIRYLKKFDKPGTRKALDRSYLDQIDQMLERFDLRQVSGKEIERRASLANWLKSQEELGLDPVIDQRLVEDAQRQHYSTLTLDEFRAMVEAVKSIEHLGRLKNKLLTAKNRREFKAIAEELAESIITNANRSVTEKNAITKLEKFGEGVRSFLAHHRKFSSILREMDGGKDGGPMWEYLTRSMNEAGDREVEMRAAMSERFANLFDGLGDVKLNQKVKIDALGISLRREELLVIALNSGNNGNVQRLLDGGINASLTKVSPAQLRAVLNTLTDKEWDFVEGVWKMIEDNRPAIAAQERALTGVEPKWVEPNPFVLESGRTIRGGYFPAKYNSKFSTRSNELEAVTDLRQQMKGAAGHAATRKSYTETRAKEVKGRPLRLDLGVIAQHINEVTHRLAWQEWLVDARRILADDGIDRAIRDHYGVELLGELKQQLVDIAEGDKGATNAAEVFMNHIRAGTTVAGLGWNIMTSLMQPTGLTQSIQRVGAGWIGKGVAKYVAAPFEVTKEVHDKSSMMENRAKTFNRELNEVLNSIRETHVSRLESSYFYLIQKFQQQVDVPTWLGAYEKACADPANLVVIDGKLDDSRAIALADQAVIDSQGSGQLKDLASIQRGGPMHKMFTMFYSFFNTAYNLAAEQTRATTFTNPAMIGKLAASYLLIYTLPTIWTFALKEALRGDDDDDSWEKITKKLAAEQINFILGTMVFAREIGGAISGFNGYQGPAGTRFFSEVGKLIKQTGQGDFDKAFVKALLNVAAIASPVRIPSGQITKSVEGIVAVIDGKAGPQAILVGPPLKD